MHDVADKRIIGASPTLVSLCGIFNYVCFNILVPLRPGTGERLLTLIIMPLILSLAFDLTVVSILGSMLLKHLISPGPIVVSVSLRL